MKRLVLFGLLLLTGCHTWPPVRPMSAQSRAAIERASAEMREATSGVVFPPTK